MTKKKKPQAKCKRCEAKTVKGRKLCDQCLSLHRAAWKQDDTYRKVTGTD